MGVLLRSKQLAISRCGTEGIQTMRVNLANDLDLYKPETYEVLANLAVIKKPRRLWLSYAMYELEHMGENELQETSRGTGQVSSKREKNDAKNDAGLCQLARPTTGIRTAAGLLPRIPYVL